MQETLSDSSFIQERPSSYSVLACVSAFLCFCPVGIAALCYACRVSLLLHEHTEYAHQTAAVLCGLPHSSIPVGWVFRYTSTETHAQQTAAVLWGLPHCDVSDSLSQSPVQFQIQYHLALCCFSPNAPRTRESFPMPGCWVVRPETSPSPASSSASSSSSSPFWSSSSSGRLSDSINELVVT